MHDAGEAWEDVVLQEEIPLMIDLFTPCTVVSSPVVVGMRQSLPIKRIAPVSKETLSDSQNNRADHEPILIDEVSLHLRLGECGTASNSNVFHRVAASAC